MPRILIILCLLSNLFISPAWSAQSQPRLPNGDFYDLEKTGTATVSAIITPQTLQLDDGRIINLSGLDFPDLKIDMPGELSLTAKRVLEDMLLGQRVHIYQTKDPNLGRINRMEHQLAHLQRASDEVWVQGALLYLGLARVKTSQWNPDMARQMLRLEDQARSNAAGLWAVPTYQVQNADKIQHTHDGFAIVEGRIHSAALSNNRIFLNFGEDWRTDFTVSIAPGDKRLFSKQGLDPLSWNGDRVRVRGWMREYNGPYIEIDHPQAIEFLFDLTPDALQHP